MVRENHSLRMHCHESSLGFVALLFWAEPNKNQ